MRRRLLFASGDVGGARTLHPVAAAAVAAGHEVHLVMQGHIAGMPPITGAQLHFPKSTSIGSGDAVALVGRVMPETFCFATSVHDQSALRLAQAAQHEGIPILHLLDNWTSYRRRLELDGQVLRPDLHAVMDEVAAEGVAKAGFSPQSILITGTPALSGLPQVQRSTPGTEGLNLVFVSEPVAMDQGSDPASPLYRGYVETTVLALLVQAMKGDERIARLDILPHPREDTVRLDASWKALDAGFAGGVVTAGDRDTSLARAHAVIGMSSILLYEMWLRGWPVASLQPGLRLPELRMLADKSGLVFFDNADAALIGLRRWKDEIVRYRPPEESVKERVRHDKATQAILAALMRVAAERGRAVT